MESDDADYMITLPSDKIAEVMEAWFNEVMFRRKVKVINLKMANDLCMFSLAEIPNVAAKEELVYNVYGAPPGGQPVLLEKGVRISNGQRSQRGRARAKQCLCKESGDAHAPTALNAACPVHGSSGVHSNG